MPAALPQPQSIIRVVVLTVAFVILMIGLAIAQTAPPADQPRQSNREIAQACRAEMKDGVRGSDRREAMRQCVEKKRESAGLNTRSDRKAERKSNREKSQNARKACRTELKDQRFTEAERRDAIQACLAKSDPRQAKMLECRKQAEEKKLERGSREFRQHMRACNKG